MRYRIIEIKSSNFDSSSFAVQKKILWFWIPTFWSVVNDEVAFVGSEEECLDHIKRLSNKLSFVVKKEIQV